MEVKDVLNTIDDFLADPDNQMNGKAGSLWSVLSALRDPDPLGMNFEKIASTSVLRAKVFPKTATLAQANPSRCFIPAVCRRNICRC